MDKNVLDDTPSMQRVTILCGSADPDGATRTMCGCARSHLESKGVSVNLIVVSDMDVSHCRDCDGCRDGMCVLDDEMDVIYDAFATSDMLILACPIHFSGPSSLIKLVMDRFQPYWFDETLPHPSHAVALLCGGSPEPRFDATIYTMRAFAITTGMEWKGQYCLGDTDSGVDLERIRSGVSSFLDGVIGDGKG